MGCTRFLLNWFLSSLGAVLIGIGDLALNQSLKEEHSFSMEPDINKIGQLLHGAGRLMHNSPALFLMNAFLLGGLVGLGIDAVVTWRARSSPHGKNQDRESVI